MLVGFSDELGAVRSKLPGVDSHFLVLALCFDVVEVFLNERAQKARTAEAAFSRRSIELVHEVARQGQMKIHTCIQQNLPSSIQKIVPASW